MEITRIFENIYTFPIVLPNNPLKWLNCYVIRGGGAGRNLLIDTGFNLPECYEALLEGMRELGLEPGDTDVFLSHAHADHSGNAYALQQLGCRIFISEIDFRVLETYDWDQRRLRAIEEGMPEAVMDEIMVRNPAVLYVSKSFRAQTLKAGDRLCYGGYELECILSPGHTPGHMCLYDRQHRIIFLGDHVLFDITPNINSRGPGSDALGDYLGSLRRLMELDVETALPGHRTRGSQSLGERVQGLISHHEQRLAEAESIAAGNPGLTAYEIAGQMSWRIRSRNWEEFPPSQKWFAVSEALAHLDRLVKLGRLRRQLVGGKARYFPILQSGG